VKLLPSPLSSLAVAAQIGGVHGGPEQTLTHVAGLDQDHPGRLVFSQKRRGGQGCLLVADSVTGTHIVVPDPKGAFIQLLEQVFGDGRPLAGRHPTAVAPADVPQSVHLGPHSVVQATVVLHEGVVIGAGAVIGAGCEIGPGTWIHPKVVLYPGVVVGADCQIHAGSVLGGPGFGLHPGPKGLFPIPHIGRLILGNGVHVGANCTVDRAFISETTLGNGVMLDNQVHIGHNCRIGDGSIIAAQTGLSGSVTLEEGVILAGQVGVVDHVNIGAHAQVGAGSGVMRDVPAGRAVLGSPADLRVRTLRRWAAWLKG
jgi:UDP-3-O-[3-hydroxymyristoyl] glucosamine N-acyltransferase